MSLASTLARYRKVRGLLTPFLVTSLGAMLILAARARPEQVVVATLVLPLVLFVRHRLSRDPLHGAFLTEIFLWGFLLRAFVGLVIYHFELWGFYGGDSTSYDGFGWQLAEVWHGREFGSEYLHKSALGGSNPGIVYLTAAFYYVFGHHLLLLQFVLSVIGAATPILVVKIADELFGDREVSIISGLLAAFFPSIVMWTSQLMKEAPVLFCLCLIVYSMQQAVVRFRYRYPVYIVAALVAIHFLRFYMFYSMVAALMAALIAPSRPLSAARLVRHLAVSGIVLAGVVYLLGGRDILTTFQEHTKLETIQTARLDQATGLGMLGRPPESRFREDADVSTPAGALRHLPYGILYVMFGPFPWEIRNLRQALALPEGLLWWMMFPALVRGLWLAVRHRLPESWLILIFSAGVLLPYSFSQGNVGTAYRQRIQFQIFLFIFVALGYVWKKRRRLARALVRQERSPWVRAAAGQG